MGVKLPNGVVFKDIMLDCVLGHYGSGIWQYKIYPSYNRLINVVIDTKTPVGAKSTLYPRRIGNYRDLNPLTWFKYVKRIEKRTGLQNAINMTNDGPADCSLGMLKAIGMGIDVKPNLYIDFTRGLDEALRRTGIALDILELILGKFFNCLIKNDSCTNSGEDLEETIAYNAIATEWIKKRTEGKVAVIDKVSCVHPFEQLEELERKGADAIIGVNSIPHRLIYPNKKSKMWKVGGGGISGAPAFKQAYDYNKEAVKHVSIPYFMGCGVTCEDDILAYFDIGADVVIICSWAALYSSEVADILEKFNG